VHVLLVTTYYGAVLVSSDLDLLWFGLSPVLQAAAENAALRALKQAKQTAEQEAEAAAKRAELAAAAADPWLNEDTNQAASALSPVRVRTAAARRSCTAACML
jgi:hypothetical protein